MSDEPEALSAAIGDLPKLAHRRPLSTSDSETSATAPSRTSTEDFGLQPKLERIRSETAECEDGLVVVKIFREFEAAVAERRNRRLQRQKQPQEKPKYFHLKPQYTDMQPHPQLYSMLDDPDFKANHLYGFFIFFWLAIGFFLLSGLTHALLEDNHMMILAPVLSIFTTGLHKIALTDLVMYLSTYVSFFVQYLCRKEVLQWYKIGRFITSLYELLFCSFWFVFITKYVVHDQWIGRIFLILHMFVLLMKIHSYSFYNGYLWRITGELQKSEKYLQQLKEKVLDSLKMPAEDAKSSVLESIAFCKYELLSQSWLLEKAKDDEVITRSLEELQTSLVCFPNSINVKDYFTYTMFPTVLYTLVFKRSEKIRWWFVFEKACALVGIIFVMLQVAELWMYPLVVKCVEFKAKSSAFHERAVFATLALIDIIPPFTTEYLLQFYLIWDVILNLIGELSRFPDRDFYGPWWASTDWYDYARLWNKPVHHFLRRHVYHSTIFAFSLSNTGALLVTFLTSSVVHELAMYVIFGKIRGFLFFFQMFQIPLVLMYRSKLLRGRKKLCNVLCWLGLILGPPIITIMYLVF